MKKIIFNFIVFTLILIVFSSCRKPYPACDVENPLTDLPWLKELIDEYEKWAIPFHVKIYQSTYRDGTCFLLDLCVGCPDNGLLVRNCEGDAVCYYCEGCSDISCLEYNIDIDNKKLIWKKKKLNKK